MQSYALCAGLRGAFSAGASVCCLQPVSMHAATAFEPYQPPEPCQNPALEDWLQASAKRVVVEYSSIVRRSACCAPLVMLQGGGSQG